MASTVMMAPNPNRSMAIDRVLVVGRSEDGSTLRVLSIDGLQSSEWAKKEFTRYFVGNATWNLVALVALVVGAAASFLWQWWAFVPALVVAGWAGFRGKSSGGGAATRILADHPWALERFIRDGLVWETPANKVVSA
ncbi:hypothetical protein [Aureimonas phyllosphaerae]|uniref:Uncharacterized protein n=1 Tax=Aureimonas phyllosphaerae TaxID=1166078 RepID=A0A7W6BZK5_9HYPH|nr:hypothetical protein [Aureimonas phyllosphaerae]MBB3938098.1 hypothetical protein [Aureimonas phyllosphaerae]MBB3962105.1 hypothetical protein [Aureimonas phyllosphaerae]SFF55961.1 hypothetical protein SAMN05216566_12822 [Aureimonas phyllosphaerae]